jgi:hypothetical protein
MFILYDGDIENTDNDNHIYELVNVNIQMVVLKNIIFKYGSYNSKPVF